MHLDAQMPSLQARLNSKEQGGSNATSHDPRYFGRMSAFSAARFDAVDCYRPASHGKA
jgi:hypothetical protein